MKDTTLLIYIFFALLYNWTELQSSNPRRQQHHCDTAELDLPKLAAKSSGHFSCLWPAQFSATQFKSVQHLGTESVEMNVLKGGSASLVYRILVETHQTPFAQGHKLSATFCKTGCYCCTICRGTRLPQPLVAITIQKTSALHFRHLWNAMPIPPGLLLG